MSEAGPDRPVTAHGLLVSNEQRYSLTFGEYNQSTQWTDVRSLTWRELAGVLTRHETGVKEGTCVVPALFSGNRRQKAHAVRIEVAFLDSDSGAQLHEISGSIKTFGWAAVISSTYSHLTKQTIIKRSHWDRFVGKHSGQAELVKSFLLTEKHYLLSVAAGAQIAMESAEYITIVHSPCPKFRVAIPLLRPWVASEYRDQDQANAHWADRVAALAAALRLENDQACIDTSRLFYLPRRPRDGPTPEIAIVEGAPCEIFSLPSVSEGAVGGSKQRNHRHRDKIDSYTDPDTGEIVDLVAWARQHAAQFEIVAALRARRPAVVLHEINGSGRYIIQCANEDEHSQAGTDGATIILNASQSDNNGFVYHCRHGHCDGRDRLVFLRKMLEQRWLYPADLIDARFLQNPRENLRQGAKVELTEHDVALAFTRRYSGRLRFCHTTGAWYVWSGTHWRRDETRLAFAWARLFVAELSCAAPSKVRASTGRAAFAGAVERFAQADEALAVSSKIWNQDPWLLATPGGTVDLRTGQLRPANQADHISRITAVAPGATISCPAWLRFLTQATGEDQDLVDFLQRWFGYCLTGITREHSLLFVYGPGGNGKSVMLMTVAGILGAYAATAAMDTFTVSHSDRHPTDLAMLDGARMVIATETDEGRAWAEARVKALTGGDAITARFMRQDFFTFTPAFKLTISGNHKPTLSNVDDAARRRFNIASFLNKPLLPDPHLAETLKGEGPGILRWMIDGCLAWQREGLSRPNVVLAATDDYFAEQDVLSQWVDECCECNSRIGDTRKNLFDSWRTYAVDRAEDPHNSKWFATMLEREGYLRVKDCELFRGRGFRGIRVRSFFAAGDYQDRYD